MNLTKNEYIEYFREKYPYISDNDLEMTYELAKEKIINTLYPFDENINEVPNKYTMKVMEVMEELIDTSDMRHYTSYSENGVKWTKMRTDLESLQDLTPHAG